MRSRWNQRGKPAAGRSLRAAALARLLRAPGRLLAGNRVERGEVVRSVVANVEALAVEEDAVEARLASDLVERGRELQRTGTRPHCIADLLLGLEVREERGALGDDVEAEGGEVLTRIQAGRREIVARKLCTRDGR